MSTPRLATVVSHVLGSGGVASDISDSSLATPNDGGPCPLLKLIHHVRDNKRTVVLIW